MTPEERAESMVEVADRGGGCQSMRLRGQSNLLWHSADAELMADRRRETVAAVAAAIRDAVAAERERCAGMAEERAAADPHEHAYEFGLALAAAIRKGG